MSNSSPEQSQPFLALVPNETITPAPEVDEQAAQDRRARFTVLAGGAATEAAIAEPQPMLAADPRAVLGPRRAEDPKKITPEPVQKFKLTPVPDSAMSQSFGPPTKRAKWYSRRKDSKA